MPNSSQKANRDRLGDPPVAQESSTPIPLFASSKIDGVRLVTRAAYFAAQAHRKQRRKDEDATPYINHLTEVAHLLAEAGCEASIVAAGYLHDTIEDVDVTYEELVAEFGEEIADLVLAATDDKSQPKQVRKEQQVEHAAHATPAQAALKLADKVSNLHSLMNTPPTGWPKERLAEYVAWGHRVVMALPHHNPALMQQYLAVRNALLALSSAK